MLALQLLEERWAKQDTPSDTLYVAGTNTDGVSFSIYQSTYVVLQYVVSVKIENSYPNIGYHVWPEIGAFSTGKWRDLIPTGT